jgi:hypothetical protein
MFFFNGGAVVLLVKECVCVLAKVCVCVFVSVGLHILLFTLFPFTLIPILATLT